MSGGHESGFKYCSIYAKLGHIDSFEGPLPLLLTLETAELGNCKCENACTICETQNAKNFSVFEARQMLSKCLVF